MSAHHESRATSRGLLVTGTDTAVGKTHIASGLLRAFVGRGERAVGMKPVAAGAERSPGGWINEDVVALRAAGNVQAPLEAVNPYCFEPPIAPHIAAAEVDVTVDLDRLVAAYGELAALADRVVVEGAGGFLVPLAGRSDFGTLAARLRLPVVLVVGMRLGCINHGLLTAEAILARGLTLAGWVANHVGPGMDRADENVATLKERIAAPLLARVPYGATGEAVARLLDLAPLYTTRPPEP